MTITLQIKTSKYEGNFFTIEIEVDEEYVI